MTEMEDKGETMLTIRKCVRDKMMDINEEQQTTPWATLRSKKGSNDMNMTPPKIGFVSIHLEQSLMTPLKFIISGIKKLSKQHSQYGNQ
jgi:hypothetical protein